MDRSSRLKKRTNTEQLKNIREKAPGGAVYLRRRKEGENMRTEVYKTYAGYEVCIKKRGQHPLYVTSVRSGYANCYLDYGHARAYKSKEKAEDIANKIKSGELKIR